MIALWLTMLLTKVVNVKLNVDKAQRVSFQ